MAWETSQRRASLPGNWRTLRRQILERDPSCRLGFDCCTSASTEVDHIGSPTDHRPEMLRGVCSPCHQRRTQAQAQAAKPKRTRPKPTHPGRLT